MPHETNSQRILTSLKLASTLAADLNYVPTVWAREQIRIKFGKPGAKSTAWPLTLEDLNFLKTLPGYVTAQERAMKSRAAYYARPYVPANLRSYNTFHTALDNFVHLLRVYYTPLPDIKRRSYRLDLLLQRYMAESVSDNDKIRRLLIPAGLKPNRGDAKQAILKVWYNELAYGTPSMSDPLILCAKGIKTNLESSRVRFAFPSWKVIQAYYSIYYSYRALCELTGVQYRAEEHGAPLRAFKSTKFQPASKCLIGFPFSIQITSNTRSAKRFEPISRKPHLQYQYCNHRRPPNLSVRSILKRVYRVFSDTRSNWGPNRQNSEAFNLADFLYHFRTWVNYIDIHSMIQLKSEGYRSYLDQNLAVLVFFHAAFVELAAIAIFGVEDVLAWASDFEQKFIGPEPELRDSLTPRPLDTRMRIYKHVGRLGDCAWTALQPKKPELELLSDTRNVEENS